MDITRPIIALDLPSAEAALDFVGRFDGENLFVKVGMELFYAAGPSVVTSLKEAGHDVFCDLKLHDIPNTVKGCLLYTSPSPRDATLSRMPSSA